MRYEGKVLCRGLGLWLIVMVLSGCAHSFSGVRRNESTLIPARSVNLVEYGAVGDGEFLNTTAFDRALDQLEKAGGGRLVVPSGIWLTGPIRMRSNVEVHLERGALIQFSGDHTLYPLYVADFRGEKKVQSTSPIHGRNLENVAITGEGVIDGAGAAWRMLKKYKVTQRRWKQVVESGGVLTSDGNIWYPSQAALDGETLLPKLWESGSLNPADYEPVHPFLRPVMVELVECRNVLLEGVTFQNPPAWTLHPVLCEEVAVLNVTVRAEYSAQNSDALDIESCRHVVVRGCAFDVGDDGICLKSFKNAAGRRIGVPTEDVLVEDCTVFHAHGGLTIGSEMSGGVRNVRVNNCLFMGTDIGLRFKTTRGRGGIVEDIHISNINMVDIVGNAINFNMYYGGEAPQDLTDVALPPVSEETPQFRDIHIENLMCRGANAAIFLQGLPEMPIRDITLRNVSITSRDGVYVMDAEGVEFADVKVVSPAVPLLTELRVDNSKLELVNE